MSIRNAILHISNEHSHDLFFQKVKTYSHVVKCNANAVVEVSAEDGNLGIALTEVSEENKLGFHLYPNFYGLGCGTAK